LRLTVSRALQALGEYLSVRDGAEVGSLFEAVVGKPLLAKGHVTYQTSLNSV
jgi:hypothetical protein